MPVNRAAIIEQQSNFYRNGFRKLIVAVLVLMVLAYILLGVMIYQHITRPIPQYFVTTSDGRLIEIKSLAQ